MFGVYLLSPRLTVLVTTQRNGKVRAAPLSWICPISFEPAMLVLAISKDNKGTLPNIKENGQFVVNIVSEQFGQKAVDCEKIKELEKVGLHTIRSQKIAIPGIMEAKARLECQLEKIVDVGGDHFLVCGRIVNSVCEKSKKVGTKYLPDIDIIRPLLHVGGQQFRAIGKEIILKRS
jgi:flavin reductase (DIM6/NTAB) family NADH-FMN oxidoreductase RutF